MSARTQTSRLSNLLPVSMAAATTLALAATLALGPLRADRTLTDPVLMEADPVGALKALTPDQVAQLTLREKQRLLAEPLDLLALSNLTVLNDLAGNAAASKAISLEAASRSQRDSVTQLSAITSYLNAKDYKNAFTHLDGLFTSRPDMAEKMFSSLPALLNDQKAVAALADILNRQPPWRAAFTSWLIQNDTSGETAFALFNALRKVDGTVEPSETRAFVTRQFTQENYDKAYFYWLDGLSQNELLKLGNIFDGSFTLEPHNQYFGWNILPLPNAEITLVPRNDPQKSNALHLTFYNNTQSFEHVYQVLHLRPGNYTLAGEWSSSRLTSPAGLTWTISCLESTTQIAATQSFNSASPHTGFSQAVTVLPDACNFQILRLVNASSAALDAKIDGDLEFSNLTIAEQN
ncbi:hypothetical protein [Aestuariivirga litoralis]|uniref:hypothetical protein n=1 Tax=Aestuariivirga litoralis TaxID=2650924 RepID=UPI0018C500DF|nr:hypothetical protein [Aestuariivirga litoralis]MBG1233224.1 hypothetical protein [Aestuariivirga litoralis]